MGPVSLARRLHRMGGVETRRHEEVSWRGFERESGL
jgi:hypothetical protein